MYDVVERAAPASAIASTQDRQFVFVDIGTNAGLYSLYVAAETRDRARILAIEAQPDMLERMHDNIKVNALRSIRVCHAAVTRVEGTVRLGIDPRDRGGSSLDAAQVNRHRISVLGPLDLLLGRTVIVGCRKSHMMT